ncbi:MAG: aspartate--tRNA ligase [Deltaproteobacteria bacterium]|nr:aspartate--tRNA ligase [Deltaproteobacteria bacterium]
MTADGTELEGMGTLRRSHSCGEIDASRVGDEVVVAGWAHRRRDHGGVIFVDLRDQKGLVQIVFRPETSTEAHQSAGDVRSEWVLLVRGVVEARSAETVNSKMVTGEIEINVHELRILNSATPPPFAIEEEAGADEAVRMKYRIHDLRRPPLQRALAVRDRLSTALRASFGRQGFMEIETPMLARATPEGARDFLVPSRLHAGSFYALPQSPQIMKQLLMVSGFERYYQIARCFRDEDQRADRQLEFTQVDLEMSFVGVEEVLEVLQQLTLDGCRDAAGVELPMPFPRMSYKEAMERFGCDRPDTRILLELVDLTDLFATSGFKAFRGAVDQGGIVKCLPVHDADGVSRSEIDRLESFVRKELGARGLGWIRIAEDGEWRSPIVKFLTDEERAEIVKQTDARPGSLLFFQADAPDKANAILSRLRIDLGEKLGRVDGREWDVLFVVDFPLFERDDKGQLTYVHQPFVAPLEEDIPLLETDPEAVRGTHYDVIMNGTELGSGSLRNHRADIQRQILKVLGYSDEEMKQSFGFMLDALELGAPPHGGFAFGFDRMVMVLAHAESLRDVVAFPKTQRGQDLLMQAPSPVAAESLDELSIRVRAPKPE